MSCRQPLDAYVDGELDRVASLALEEHLRDCTQCSAALGRLTALRTLLRRDLPAGQTPVALREKLWERFGVAPRPSGLSWRWAAALVAPGIAALALSLWLALAGPAQEVPRVVYHISNSATAGAALRTLSNHLNATPQVRVVVVAHNEGIDFLLRGARDESGRPFEPVVREFMARGVEFRVCTNTLERRQIRVQQVIPDAALVPSGIAEIGRLQGKEGYTYMRL